MGGGMATKVGIFALGLALGALAAPLLPGSGHADSARRVMMLIEELEADLGADRVRAAVVRADERLGAAGLY